MNATLATLLLLAAWLVLGGATGAALARRGQPAAAALAAVVAWPVLLPALIDGARSCGPFAPRIDAGFAALRGALLDPAAADIVPPEELARLEEAMHLADARIHAVDRLLADASLGEDPLGPELLDARRRAAEEVEAVLRGVAALRAQVGLLALAGDTAPVHARMRTLSARVRAIEEIRLA